MKSKENIVFLGMMGSGKSSIGKLLSKKLNLKFSDIDRVLKIAFNDYSRYFIKKRRKF